MTHHLPYVPRSILQFCEGRDLCLFCFLFYFQCLGHRPAHCRYSVFVKGMNEWMNKWINEWIALAYTFIIPYLDSALYTTFLVSGLAFLSYSLLRNVSWFPVIFRMKPNLLSWACALSGSDVRFPQAGHSSHPFAHSVLSDPLANTYSPFKFQLNRHFLLEVFTHNILSRK